MSGTEALPGPRELGRLAGDAFAHNRFIAKAGKAEIDQPDTPLLEEEILRLEIAVNDSSLVKQSHAATDSQEASNGLLQRSNPLSGQASHPLSKGRPPQQFQNEVG